jgi:flagellin
MITFFNTALSSQASVRVNTSAEKIELQTAKLSSGSRLNKTEDDAGATAQSMKFTAASGRSAIVGDQIQNALSFLEVQSSSLRQIYEIFSRISDLRVKATDATMVPTNVDAASSANDATRAAATASKTTGDRFGYQTEYQALRHQLVFENLTQFNGTPVFVTYGTGNSGLNVQLSEDGQQTMTLSRPSLFDSVEFPSGNPLEGIQDQPVLLDLTIGDLDLTIEMLASHIGTNAAEQTRLKFASDRLGIASVDFDAAKSRFADADIAQESSHLTRAKTVHQAAVNALTQATKSTEFILKLIESRQGS